MDWSDGLGALRRGLGIATRVAVARLREHGPGALSRSGLQPEHSVSGGFTVLAEFEANRSPLQPRIYLPAAPVRAGAPLIVLLHGCGQDAAAFALETGWTALADRLHVPLLLPEQREANNRGRCFQWFQPAETRRGHGEAAAIAAMVLAASSQFRSDPDRIFVAGLSAGGAMAAALLVAYPDMFAAGAAFAGLPVGSAASMVQALARMAHGSPNTSAAEWMERARRLAPRGYAGAWPRLSIWHGEADQVVAPDNSLKLAAQWRALHGLRDKPTRETALHAVWGDAVELWTLPALGHAWAIGSGEGRPAQFAVPGPVSAVREIARFWGIG